MVVVRLIGGLGNQLFQYALGRQLSIINGSKLYIDISGFENYKLHEYSLGHFAIEAEIASREMIKEISNRSFLSTFLKGQKNIIEKDYRFNRAILKKYSSKLVYLDGYWQSEKYFEAIRPIILQDFELTSNLNERDRFIVDYAAKNNTVSLHVRRGDYVSNAVFNKVHGICDLEYYRSAVDYVRKKLNKVQFVVFSDDIDWCKENLSFSEDVIFCDHNSADRNYADMFLMSCCQHNIIANSSFSWWGAWLNKNPDKIVIAPKRWYADGKKEVQTTDLIPKKWIRI